MSAYRLLSPLSLLHESDYPELGWVRWKGDAGMDAVPDSIRRHFRQVYFSRCAAADSMMGQVLDAFEAHGDLENT